MTSSKYVDAHEDMGLVIVAKPVSSMPVTGRVPWGCPVCLRWCPAW